MSAKLHGGRFRVHQLPTGETQFILTLPLSGCPRIALPRGAAGASRSKRRSGPTSRHLWVHETEGGWGTTGRLASTTVEGTTWLTLDECARTEIEVTDGTVLVTDLARKRHETLNAGQRYIATPAVKHRHT